MNDQLNCLAKIIIETIKPDYTNLIEEIEKHEFMITKSDPEREWTGKWHKILFVTSDTCIVHTRCQGGH